MDINARQADSFTRAIPATVTVVLIYGPDAGRVSERRDAEDRAAKMIADSIRTRVAAHLSQAA